MSKLMNTHCCICTGFGVQLGEVCSLWIQAQSQLSVTQLEAVDMWTGSTCVILNLTGSICVYLDYMCWKYSQDASTTPQQLKLEGWGRGLESA